MIDKEIYSIFKKGSKTYFYSSMFFPKKERRDVSSFYAFVRTADDFVDSVPQKGREFKSFTKDYYSSLSGEKTGNLVVDSFVELMGRKDIEPAWIDSFFDSMQMDLSGRQYKSINDSKDYMYGSSEVIGLVMARILGLPKQAEYNARMLGKAMQFINFIRDIDEDWRMNRTYFPKQDFEEFGLTSLDPENALENRGCFEAFVRKQLSRYWEWQAIAEQGFKHIPKRLLIPIATASEMYKWTALQIEKNPCVVFEQKVKPSVPRIVLLGGLSAFRFVVRQ